MQHTERLVLRKVEIKGHIVWEEKERIEDFQIRRSGRYDKGHIESPCGFWTGTSVTYLICLLNTTHY